MQVQEQEPSKVDYKAKAKKYKTDIMKLASHIKQQNQQLTAFAAQIKKQNKYIEKLKIEDILA